MLRSQLGCECLHGGIIKFQTQSFGLRTFDLNLFSYNKCKWHLFATSSEIIDFIVNQFMKNTKRSALNRIIEIPFRANMRIRPRNEHDKINDPTDSLQE